MFGLFAKQRGLAIVVAIAFLIVAAALAIIYFVSPRATIRITTGPEGGAGPRDPRPSSRSPSCSIRAFGSRPCRSQA